MIKKKNQHVEEESKPLLPKAEVKKIMKAHPEFTSMKLGRSALIKELERQTKRRQEKRKMK